MGTCGASCGITKTRDRERDLADRVALRAFADGRRDTPRWWPGEPVFGATEAGRLVAALQGALPCRAVVVPPADDLAATWVYAVATVADRTWVELREGVSRRRPTTTEERGLRVGLSALHRAATVQEFTVTATAGQGSAWVEEARVAGVEDRRLQMFVKASQGILRTMKITTLDAAFLEGAALEGGDPRWALLFEGLPMVSRVGVWVATA